MQISILRHAEAVLSMPDSDRPLSVNGIGECVKLGQWLIAQNQRFDLVLVSPFIRTQQTWNELVKQGLSTENVVELTELLPEADCDLAVSVIKAYADQVNSVLVISHLPLVCFLVEAFAVGEVPLFATGAIANIQLEDGALKGDLIEIVSPYQLQQNIA